MVGGGPPSKGGRTNSTQIRTFLIADVRGWTVFTQERGDEAAGKLAAKFARIAREVVEGHEGTLLELRGDEALCVFDSPRQAIRAAVELQERFVEETLADPEVPLTVGIGLDAGEAVEVEGGYRGGALNLAARLCSQARAGEILASREVVHLARRLDGVRYEDRGPVALKGLAEPVTVVRVVPETIDAVDRLRPFAAAPPPTPGPPRRRRLITVAIVAAIALIAISIPLLRSKEAPIDVAANSIARISAEDGSLVFAKALGQRPGASTIDFGSLWVAEPDRAVVARVSLLDGSIEDTVPVGRAPVGVAAGEGSVWVTNAEDGTVSRISPETNQATRTFGVGSGPSGIAVGGGALWVADAIGAQLLRVDPDSEASRPVPLAGQPSGVAFTSGGVWVSVAPAGLVRVDPTDLSVTVTHPVGNGPTALLSAFGSIWVTNYLDGTVSRVDPSTGRHLSIEVGEGPNALAAAAGSVWVANELDDSITSIDPATGTVQTIPVGGAGTSLAADGDGVWLAVGAAAAEHRGGTLTISSAGKAPESLDPAVVVINDSIEGQILALTNDGLLGYRKVGGSGGATLVPDLASALPLVSDDGLTYRFPLRAGIRYSTGELVRPEDFRYAIERAISMTPPSDPFLYLDTIVGAEACLGQPSCDLSDSIVVDEGSVTFRLTVPDPDLPFKLALSAAYPVPVGTPFVNQRRDPVPATGPYMISKADADSIELVRNPKFREWSADAQPAGFVGAILWRFKQDVGDTFDQLNAGEVDWMTDPPMSEDMASLQASDPDQVVLWPRPATLPVAMNVRKAPFDDKRVRQALAYAIDRDHIVDLLGGPTSQRPTCQVLPPNFQGYEPFCPYTLNPEGGVWSAPDVDTARALIDEADARGEPVTVWVSDDPDIGGSKEGVETLRYVVRVLNEIGLRAKLNKVDEGDEFIDGVSAGEPQAHGWGWGANYPSAADFISSAFRCRAEFNPWGYCNETLDARMDEAQQLQRTDPAAANAAWIEIEHQLVEDAVWAPMTNPVNAFAVSERMENVQVHPQWGILISRVWVR